MSLFNIFQDPMPQLPGKRLKLPGIWGVIQGVIEDGADSFVKNVFCDIVKPRVGSILKVDLIGSSQTGKNFCHTGVYIGQDKIVELTPNDDGDAIIRSVSPEEFLNSSLYRTGAFIYVACGKNDDGDCYALCEPKIANRAKQAVGLQWLGKYSLTNNNCHMFCQYCITGDKTDNSCLLGGIESALEKTLHVNDVLWRSTGNGNDMSFV